MRHPICVGEGDCCFRELVHEVEGDRRRGKFRTVKGRCDGKGDDGSDVETEGVSNRGMT